MNYIKGNYRKSIYENESGYMVGLFKIKETNDSELQDYVNKTVTFTGYFNNLNIEDKYVMYGELVNHERYGIQYQVKSYEKIIPEGKEALVIFLSSPLINGCGEKTAQAIVDTFGTEAINKIKENKDNLLIVPNITEKRAIKIYNSIIRYSASDEMVIELQKYGFSMNEAIKIINIYNEKAIEVVKQNIYELKNVIYFSKLDNIFLTFNDPDDIIRIKACIVEVMNNFLMQNGDIYYYYDEIINGLKSFFKIHVIKEIADNALKYLEQQNIITVEGEYYYLTEYYEKEKYIAYALNKINSHKIIKYKKINDVIKSIENANSIKYSELQKEAIKASLNSNVAIITGGPGTGKTTIVNAIVKSFIELNHYNNFDIMRNIALLAPTGRASKKLSEVTLLPATTIHRYLKWNKEDNSFQINENNKNPDKLIIVDEISMVDTFVMDALLKGINDDVKLIFIGDENQLPSVGGGLVLNDLIGSNQFKHILLTEIFRQKEFSSIPYLAKDIKNILISDNLFLQKDDYKFIETPSNQIKSVISQLCTKGLQKSLNEKDIIVLAPMYRGENGIDNLNVLLQNIYNPQATNKNELVVADITYRENDKIIELVNDPDNNVFNGDIGYIDSIDLKEKRLLTANFDGNFVSYKKEDLKKIKHAYAISIHKSQGSEFNHVIIPVCNSYNKMLYNKLIYTGISRAKKTLTVVGNKEAFVRGIKDNYSVDRKTTLKQRLMNK